MNNKKDIQYFGLIVMLLALFSGSWTYAQTGYSDIEGHWAKEAILKWSDYGVIKGSDGKFRPNDTISRAEMIVIINRLIICPEETHNVFVDVDPSDWFANDVFAMARQSFVRHEGNLFRPNTQVTREEATETLAIAFGIINQEDYAKKYPTKVFKDQSEILESAYPAIKEMTREGFVSGYSDGTFKPDKKVTRAEFAKMLDNMIDYMITTPGLYKGPYAPNLLIVSKGVTLDSGNDTDKLSHIYVSPSLDGEDLYLKSTLIERTYAYASTDFMVKLIGKEPYPSYYGKLTMRVTPPVYEGFSSGYGTKDLPYCIENEGQLRLLHQYIIDRKNKNNFTYFKLTSDIVLSTPWTSIGYTPDYIYRFSSKLDGGGHTISNMRISGTDQCASLIAECQGSISNLKVEGTIDIQANSQNTLYSAGGFVSSLLGTLENCSSSVDISVVGGEVIMVGGLVGQASDISKVINCTYDGKLNAEAAPQNTEYENVQAFVGGIIGHCYLSPFTKYVIRINPQETVMDYSVLKCNASGEYLAKTLLDTNKYGVSAYAGGLVGLANHHMIKESFSSAKVSAVGGYYNFAGGLVGIISDVTEMYIGDKYIESYIIESYATGDVSASDATYQNNAGGAVGQVNHGILQSCFATGKVSGSGEAVYFNAIGGLVGSVYEHGKIRDSYATGNASSRIGDALVGAVVGRVVGSVERCYGTGKAIVESANITGQNQDLYMGSWTTETFTNFYHSISDSEAMKGLVYLCFTREPQTAVNVFNKEIYKVETYKELGFDMDKIWFMSNTGYPLPKLRGVNELLQERFVVPERF